MGDGISPQSTQSANEEGRSLFVDCTTHGGVIVAKLVGPSIGQRESPIISTAILAEIGKQTQPPRAVVLDFKDVTFMNSTGLSMCIEVRNAAHKSGGKVILYRLSDNIAAVMKMTKMDRLYTIVSDSGALQKALGK